MTPATSVAVAIEQLEPGRRFQVAGLGERRGTLLRLSDLSAFVVYDKVNGERRKPIAISLHTQVLPL